MTDRISIVEVGPRDGLQNEAAPLSVDIRVDFIERLVAAGLRRIEVGSFVSPRRIPQMSGTAEVVGRLPQADGLRYSVLVPNEQGMRAAAGLPIQEIAVFASASESFSRSNINCSIAESIERFVPVVEMAAAGAIPVRGYVSCALGCPYEGKVPVASVAEVSRKLAELGCSELSLGDTIGVGTPRGAREMIQAVASELSVARLAVHFHDTRGQALANILACVEAGIRIIDSSVAGLGGCPYAPGASGNVSTEDLVYMLNGLGMETGVDLVQAAMAGGFISSQLGRPTLSKVAAAMTATGQLAPFL